MHIRSLIPPALFQLLHTPSMKLYNSYDAALGDSHGYEDPGVVQAVTRKTDAYRGGLLGLNEKRVDKRQTTQNMFVLSYLYHDRPIDVLEIGGACGASYFELSHLLPGKIRNWHVVETPAMVASAKRLFENDRLAFYTNMDEAASKLDRPDLLIAQGVIQYTKDPLKTLNAIVTIQRILCLYYHLHKKIGQFSVKQQIQCMA